VKIPTFNRINGTSLLSESELALALDRCDRIETTQERMAESIRHLERTLASYVSLTQKLTEEITQYKRNVRPR
jgi:hypothetical protein